MPISFLFFFPQIPSSAYKYEVQVSPSDTDRNGHTNQGSYVRYCCDAIQMAFSSGEVREFDTDMALYGLDVSISIYVCTDLIQMDWLVMIR